MSWTRAREWLAPSVRVGLAELPLHGQDRSLVDLDLGLFGVFDGVGAFERSGEAAQLAAEVVAASCRRGSLAPLEAMAAGCARADFLIREQALGATTATLAWVVDAQLLYVSVGDSRLYHQPTGGSPLVQVTVDEGEGNVLFNALGADPRWGGNSVAPQRGALALSAGDRLLLVTDGITGDFEPDLLTARELAVAIEGDDPQRAADQLVVSARKRDDRTALVIFLE
ncbi:MAG TPA: protein phosphatase 2C domain-containing protein [Candidatus Dormibacteraeota bacterium]|nr:protein phosphatase 2C domain-containing protein [Candidatus Dormibacteraeota bacterium]